MDEANMINDNDNKINILLDQVINIGIDTTNQSFINIMNNTTADTNPADINNKFEINDNLKKKITEMKKKRINKCKISEIVSILQDLYDKTEIKMNRNRRIYFLLYHILDKNFPEQNLSRGNRNGNTIQDPNSENLFNGHNATLVRKAFTDIKNTIGNFMKPGSTNTNTNSNKPTEESLYTDLKQLLEETGLIQQGIVTESQYNGGKRKSIRRKRRNTKKNTRRNRRTRRR